jgi:hypothetical protein
LDNNTINMKANPQVAPTKQADFRPKQQETQSHPESGAFLTLFILATAIYWALIPIWPSIGSEILGDVDTDAIRGMWGFDHIKRSMIPPNTPLWSNEINFPAGVIALTLPWTTGILLAPLGFLFGPIIAWNLSVAFMLLGFGMSTAWLAKQLTSSWAIGCIAGGLVMTQPMLLHAMSDGTPEHISLWGVPLLLGSMWKTLRHSSPRWGVISGLLAILVALDSPYHAIYSALAGFLVLPWTLIRRWNIEERLDFIWAIGSVISLCILGAIFVAALYSLFPLGESSLEEYLSLWKMNAADLRVWWQHDFQNTVVRDTSLVPSAIPIPLVWFSIILIIFGAPRSLPWCFASILMLNLSLGLNDKLPVHLSYWVGSFGYPIGESILNLNAHLYAMPGLAEIRFPQRWLVPSALCLAIGAAFGLQRLFAYKFMQGKQFPLAIIIVSISTLLCIRTSQIDLLFPKQEVPHIQFTTYIAEQPGDGALIMLPRMRPPPKSGKRSDLPVFANLADSLSSSDVQYFQTLHGRPIYDKPSLKTLYAFEGSEYIFRLLREWDDLAHPKVTGNPIPASAYDPRFTKRRRIGLQELLEEGLRWIVVDQGAYNDQALEILEEQITPYMLKKEFFREGDGVIVFELAPKEEISQIQIEAKISPPSDSPED